MIYTKEIVISVPIRKVAKLFDNPNNLKHWHPGLVKVELLEGERGQPDAKSRLTYEIGKKRMELIETITRKNPPHEFSGRYETDGMMNYLKNSFTEVDKQTTLYKAEVEYRFTSFKTKSMAFFMPWFFKKQTEDSLKRFKAFVDLKTNPKK